MPPAGSGKAALRLSGMKILHVIANLAPRYGGPYKACWEMARAVARLGHEVSIYTTNQDGPGILEAPTDRPVWRDGVEIRYFPVQPPRYWATSLPLARALGGKIKAVDLVHVHNLYLFHDLVAGYHCRRHGVPYLIQPHGSLDPFIHRRHRGRKKLLEWGFQNRTIRQASAILFTAADELELAQPFTFQTPGLVVPLGIDLTEFAAMPEPGCFRAMHPEIGGRAIILFLGRVNFKKGLDILARAFGTVARRREDVHLVVAGPDHEGWGDKIRSLLQEEGVLGRTTFTGMLLGTEKMAAWRDAAMFALPSYSENFGLAVGEAMAAGLPVIISDKVNIWREVEAAGAGKVIPCEAGKLSDAILDILADPERAQEMGKKGQALVRNEFQWDKIAVKLQATYAGLIDRHHRGRHPKR
jgi:glycosyltransferase involved in cell wall biosynthesis